MEIRGMAGGIAASLGSFFRDKETAAGDGGDEGAWGGGGSVGTV